jgi:uncharacterized protein
MTRKHLNSVLVKPAGPDCNLACDYCFYTCKSGLFPETKPHRMSEETLTEMIRQLMQQAGEQVGLGWQGGEPTLMGLPFFEKAVDLMGRFGHNQAVGNGLQTNGLLIDKDWMRFLRQYNFLVGLSLDGPQPIHDRYRLTKSGLGTWTTVVDRAKLMLDGGVAVNALSVVTDFAADYPEEIYSFLKELGLDYMQFIPCVEFDPAAPGNVQPLSVTPEKYSSFLCTLFDLWIKDFDGDRPTTSIRYFDSIFYRYVGLTPPECSLQDDCGTYLVVEHTGDVYACDFFVEPKWHLGNIHEDTMDKMLGSEKQNIFGAMKKNLPPECIECRWLKYCTGGCPRYRPSPDQPGYLCEAYRRFFHHADIRMRDLATTWKANNAPGFPKQIASID